MNKNKELIKNTIILFFGKFCTQILSFLLVPIYTNFLLPSDYGYVDLLQTYITLLVPVVILRIDSAAFRFLIDSRENNIEKNNIISDTILFLIIQMILFTIVGIFISTFISIKYIFLIIVNIVSIAMSSVLLQLARGLGKNNYYSVASIIAGVITLISNVICLFFLNGNGGSILLSSSIANVFCSLYLIVKLNVHRMSKRKYLSRKKIKEMFKYSLPMIPDGLSWWIINVSDRTIISYLISSSANGIYAISSKFSNILVSIFQIFNMSWQESASLNIEENDKEEFFSNVLTSTYKIFFSLCIIILTCIPILFPHFIGKEYISAYCYIPILLLGNLYNAIANVIGAIYIAKKNTKAVAKTTLFSAILNIIINLLLIKKVGLYAAAISTTISYILLCFYRYIDVQKYFKIKIDFKILIITNLLFMFCGILYYYNSYIINLINLIFGIIIGLILNINIIKKILKKGR